MSSEICLSGPQQAEGSGPHGFHELQQTQMQRPVPQTEHLCEV